jgi:hypothetical protein
MLDDLSSARGIELPPERDTGRKTEKPAPKPGQLLNAAKDVRRKICGLFEAVNMDKK